jgi:hypothetical protein
MVECIGSAPLALAGEEFVNLLEEEADHPEDDFEFEEHGGSELGCVLEWG